MPKNDNPSEEELLAKAVIFIEEVEASRLTGGPKTEAGKRISSRNSRKHGLMSNDIERRFDKGLEMYPAYIEGLIGIRSRKSVGQLVLFSPGMGYGQVHNSIR